MSENTKYGTYALNTGQGIQNTAVGYSSASNTTADAISNTSLGAWSLTKTTTGDNNVAVGCNSLLENTTGKDNVGVGAATLLESTTANNNTAVGANALQYNTTGSNNVAIGAKSGFDMTTQSNVICIGADSEPYFTDSSGNYKDNQTVIGNADITDTYIYGNLTVSGSIAGITGGFITGPTGPTGPAGTVGVTGSSYGDYLYWNSSAWTVGSTKISLGSNAGFSNQGANTVAIGINAGSSNQGSDTIAIGRRSGNTSQKAGAIALGLYSGKNSQANDAIAIGRSSGQNNQGLNAIALGLYSASSNQGSYAIALGLRAGDINQGNNSIAIGNNAGRSNQPSNSIVLNASGTDLNGNTGSAFYVNPVRGATGPQSLYYNDSTKEITYAQSNMENYWTQATDGSISANNVTISRNISSLGSNVINYDYANNSSNQLKYMTYYDTNNRVWFSDNISNSSTGFVSGNFIQLTIPSTISINDIGMSKDPDSSGNLTIAYVVNQTYTGNTSFAITSNTASSSSNLFISRNNGNSWSNFTIKYNDASTVTVAVSQDGNKIVVGSASPGNGCISTFTWAIVSGVGSWVSYPNYYTQWNPRGTSVAINNAFSVTTFDSAEGQGGVRNMRLRTFTGIGGFDSTNNGLINFLDVVARYGSNVAISKNTLPASLTSIPYGNGSFLSIPASSYVCVSINDWSTDATSDNGTFSLGVGFTNGSGYAGLGRYDGGVFYNYIKINGETLYDKNESWRIYGVDVSPDGDVILLTVGYTTSGDFGTIAAPYILVSYDYGANFNTLVYDTTKDFGRIKVIPNPVTGNYDGSGSLLVYNKITDDIYVYNNYNNITTPYNMTVNTDINCRNLYANQKVWAAGVQLTSDYRIKDNVQTLDSSVVDLSKINPVSYYNKVSKQDEYGFIAHELQESLPLLVNGEKDGESYQSVNYIGLIPILVKEIQTLRQEVNELKNKV